MYDHDLLDRTYALRTDMMCVDITYEEYLQLTHRRDK